MLYLFIHLLSSFRASFRGGSQCIPMQLNGLQNALEHKRSIVSTTFSEHATPNRMVPCDLVASKVSCYQTKCVWGDNNDSLATTRPSQGQHIHLQCGKYNRRPFSVNEHDLVAWVLEFKTGVEGMT